MRNIMTSMGLVGLLGCKEFRPEQVQMNFQLDCTVPVEIQRAALLDDYLLRLETLWSDKIVTEEFRLDAKKSSFAKTVPDLVYSTVRYSTINSDVADIKNQEINSFYMRAKNLAGCMDPTLNFDQEVVDETYRQAIGRLEKEGYYYLSTTDIKFANGVAGPAGIDVKPYATRVVEAARQRGIDVKPYATYVVDAEVTAAVNNLDSYGNQVYNKSIAKSHFEFAEQIATEAQLTDRLQRLSIMERMFH